MLIGYCSQWIQEARYERPDVPVILVACKQDLRDDTTLVPGQLVDFEEVRSPLRMTSIEPLMKACTSSGLSYGPEDRRGQLL